VVERLVQYIVSFKPKKFGKDSWGWAGDGFSTRNVYFLLHNPVGQEVSKFCDTLRFIPVSSKFAGLSWRIALDRLPTRSNLRQKGVNLLNDYSSCPLYHDDKEPVSHLFFSCRFSHLVWFNCYKWLGVRSARPIQTEDHLWHHGGLVIGRGVKRI